MMRKYVTVSKYFFPFALLTGVFTGACGGNPSENGSDDNLPKTKEEMQKLVDERMGEYMKAHPIEMPKPKDGESSLLKINPEEIVTTKNRKVKDEFEKLGEGDLAALPVMRVMGRLTEKEVEQLKGLVPGQDRMASELKNILLKEKTINILVMRSELNSSDPGLWGAIIERYLSPAMSKAISKPSEEVIVAKAGTDFGALRNNADSVDTLLLSGATGDNVEESTRIRGYESKHFVGDFKLSKVAAKGHVKVGAQDMTIKFERDSSGKNPKFTIKGGMLEVTNQV